MTAPTIAVVHEAFHAALADTWGAADLLEETTSTAVRRLDGLLAGWRGPAADAFAAAFAQWHAGATDALVHLRGMAAAIDDSRRLVTVADEDEQVGPAGVRRDLEAVLGAVPR